MSSPAPTPLELAPWVGLIYNDHKDMLLHCQLVCLAMGNGTRLTLSHRPKVIVVRAQYVRSKDVELLRMRKVGEEEERWEVQKVFLENFKPEAHPRSARRSAPPLPVSCA